MEPDHEVNDLSFDQRQQREGEAVNKALVVDYVYLDPLHSFYLLQGTWQEWKESLLTREQISKETVSLVPAFRGTNWGD